MAYKYVTSRCSKELVRRRSDIGLFKIHDLLRSSMWASKCSTSARRREGNTSTCACASRKAANKNVLPTYYLAELLMMAKRGRSSIKLTRSSYVTSMRSHSCWALRTWSHVKRHEQCVGSFNPSFAHFLPQHLKILSCIAQIASLFSRLKFVKCFPNILYIVMLFFES